MSDFTATVPLRRQADWGLQGRGKYRLIDPAQSLIGILSQITCHCGMFNTDKGSTRNSLMNHRTLLAGLTALVIVQFAVNTYLISRIQPSAAQWSLIFGVELILTLAAVLFVWRWLQTRIFDPLKRLAEEITLIAHGKPDRQPQIEDRTSMGPLPHAVAQLGRELLRARTETAKAMQASAQKTADLNARLEAILRDLADGLVVCNLEHNVVLINQAGLALLGVSEEIGLGRGLNRVLDEGQLHQALAELQRARTSDHTNLPVVEFSCSRRNRLSDPLNTRMSLIIDTDGTCEGYVLIFSAGSAVPDPNAEMLIHAIPPISPRPEFYDFDLFRPQGNSSLLGQALDHLPITVFDLETTGLKPSLGDEIVQIAGVRIINGRLLTGEVFDKLVNPGRDIPESSTIIHGITEEMVANHPPIEVVLPDFERFAADSVLAAHNAAFDMKCLSLKGEQTHTRFDHPILDTLLLSLLLQPAQKDHSLDAICDRYGVEVEGRHTASGDAKATAQVLLAMLPVLREKGLDRLGTVLKACANIYEMRSLQQHY